jgi:hypothetical protein
VRTEEIKVLLLAQILTGHYLPAKLPSTVIRGVHMEHNHETQSSTTHLALHQGVAVQMSPLLLKLLNYLLLARSEITCHPMITCQKSLHSVAQHNIFEIALIPADEDSSHSFSEIKLQNIQIYLNASTCKE